MIYPRTEIEIEQDFMNIEKEKKTKLIKDTSINNIINIQKLNNNIKEIIIKSIELEQYLLDNNIDKTSKIFEHIINLTDENIWLVTYNLDNYPYIKEMSEFYNSEYNTWFNFKNDPKIVSEVKNSIYNMRLKIMKLQIIDNSVDININQCIYSKSLRDDIYPCYIKNVFTEDNNKKLEEYISYYNNFKDF